MFVAGAEVDDVAAERSEGWSGGGTDGGSVWPRFHDPTRPYLHPEDVDIALDVDRYDFAVRANIEDGRPVARMEYPA